MNLRAYFQKIREVEKTIINDVVFVASLAGEEGGLAGILSQVTRAAAAKLIVEQRSRLATEEEVESLLAKQEAEREKLLEENVAQRLQVAIVSDKHIEAMRKSHDKKPAGASAAAPAEKTSEKKKD